MKISIHALLAESDTEEEMIFEEQIISIHALLAESDAFTTTTTICIVSFLSTLSLRRATFPIVPAELVTLVFLSTLSLRRATCVHSHNNPRIEHFYPRSPCGERPAGSHGQKTLLQFLSTLSLRRATYDTYAKVLRVNISIHALLAESDPHS